MGSILGSEGRLYQRVKRHLKLENFQDKEEGRRPYEQGEKETWEGGRYLFEKRSLPRRTRIDTRRREEERVGDGGGAGAERNKSLMAPSPRPDGDLFRVIGQSKAI